MALIYNQGKFKDLSKVVCPPYDIISPRGQQYYHNLSPYNFIHILFGKDVAGENKYTKARIIFKGWLKNKVLIKDDKPAVYFYSQRYPFKGKILSRHGFISLLHLDDKCCSVFGHEHTRLEPKEDRLRLLRQVKANLSPIFVIFLDTKKIIQGTCRRHIRTKAPFIDIVDDEKVNHKLWRIDSPKVLAGIQASLSNENIFIADGHHRYEVACAYRDEMRRRLTHTTGQEVFNYILCYFTNTDSRGLTIMPIHRLVKIARAFDFKAILDYIRECFDVEQVKGKNRLFSLMQKAGHAEHLLGAYCDSRYWLLRLRNEKILDKIIRNKPKVYRALDVAILNHLILKNIPGCNPEDKNRITFSPDIDDLIQWVDSNPQYAAFFLNPVKIQQIISVALKGERMPSKSTYFYPKVLSGLVINKFDS